MLRVASRGISCSKELQQKLQLSVSPRRVGHVLNHSSNLVYRTRKKASDLTKQNKAKEKVSWTLGKWMTIVFSDENKFNLEDRPDEIQCYWYDLRKEEQVFSDRPFGGGSVMIWGAFSVNGKAELVVIEGRQNVQKYVKVLETSLLPFLKYIMARTSIFQQDNASIYTAKVTKAWFEDKDVTVLDWPAKSPNLNQIENVWSILSRQVCIQGRQFETEESLISYIKECWNDISLLTINNMV